MKLEEAVRRIHWLGHDTFRIDASKVIYFDPFQISGGPPADLILVSHEHFDHCSPEDISKIQQPDTIIVTDPASAKKLSGDVRAVSKGDRVEAKGIVVEVFPAYNTNKKFHQKSAGMLSFVVTVDGIRIYHAGDTDLIPEMNEIETDIALLPVSGTYVMTAEEAVEAARVIRPKVAIPMHYGAIVGSSDDAAHFEASLKDEMRVVLLEKE